MINHKRVNVASHLFRETKKVPLLLVSIEKDQGQFFSDFEILFKFCDQNWKIYFRIFTNQIIFGVNLINLKCRFEAKHSI